MNSCSDHLQQECNQCQNNLKPWDFMPETPEENERERMGVMKRQEREKSCNRTRKCRRSSSEAKKRDNKIYLSEVESRPAVHTWGWEKKFTTKYKLKKGFVKLTWQRAAEGRCPQSSRQWCFNQRSRKRDRGSDSIEKETWPSVSLW